MGEEVQNESLKKTLEHYQDLMHHSGDFIFSVTESGNILFANNHFQKALDYKEDQLAGLNFNSILHYYSSVDFRRLFSIIADHQDVIIHLTTRLGKELIIQGNCTTFKEGDQVVLKGLFHDITTDFKKNKNLEKSEVKFKLLFDKSLNPIVYYDSKGIIDCNEAFVHILGYDHRDEIVGKLPSEFSADVQPGIDDPEKAAWKIDNLALQNGGHQFEWMHKRKNGEEFLVSASMSVIELDGKKAFFAMWNDLSIRFDAEQAVRESENQIRLKNERLRILNDINQLLIQDLDFISKVRNILKSITMNLSIHATNISILNPELTEVMSYAYTEANSGKFYDGKLYKAESIPGIQTLLQGEIYSNPEIDPENCTLIEKRLYETGLRSHIGIPILTANSATGFLSVASREPNMFDDELVSLLTDVSKSIGIFIEQKSQTELSGKYGKLEESLHALGTKILSFLNIEEIGKQLYAEVNEIMDAPIFGFGLHNAERNTLEFKGIVEYGELLPPFEFSLSDKESLGPMCFNNEMDIVVNDFEKDVFKFLDVYDRTAIPGEAPESLVYLPLIFKGTKIGVITAQSYKKNKYLDKNIFVLKMLASYIAIAAHNADLYEASEEQVDLKTREIIMQKIRLQKSNYHQQLISEIGRKISSSLDLNKVFEELHEQVDKLMDATIFGIRIYNKEIHAIEYRYEIESGIRSHDGFIEMDNKDNYSVWCLENNKAIFINDNLREHKKYVSKIHVVAGEMPESLLFQPLYIDDLPLGVITVQSFHKNAYNRTHLEMLASLANYTAMAIQNARTHEELTNELNRLKSQQS